MAFVSGPINASTGLEILPHRGEEWCVFHEYITLIGSFIEMIQNDDVNLTMRAKNVVAGGVVCCILVIQVVPTRTSSIK